MLLYVSHFYVLCVDLHVYTVHAVAGSHLYMYVACTCCGMVATYVWCVLRAYACALFKDPMFMVL